MSFNEIITSAHLTYDVYYLGIHVEALYARGAHAARLAKDQGSHDQICSASAKAASGRHRRALVIQRWQGRL